MDAPQASGREEDESALWGVALLFGIGMELVFALVIASAVIRTFAYFQLTSPRESAWAFLNVANQWATPSTASIFVFLPLMIAAAYIIWCTSRSELPARWRSTFALLDCCVTTSVLALFAGAFDLGYALAANPGYSQDSTELASIIIGLVTIMVIGTIGGVTAIHFRRTLLRFISAHDEVEPTHW
jgi:hypothetical protein